MYKQIEKYIIYPNGEVVNIKLNKILKPYTHKKNGYQIIKLCINGKKHAFLLHRLVANSFIPNPENKPEVNHKNGIKTDNTIYNLEWATKSENELHKVRVLGKRPWNAK